MKSRTGYAISIGILVLCLSGAWLLHRRAHRPHNRPLALSGEQLTEFTSLDPIDAHTHIFQTDPAFVAMLGRLHMHVLDILYVDDTDTYQASLPLEKQDALKFLASSPGRATLCTTFDPFKFKNPKFAKEAIGALNQDFANGAVAAKIWKNIGMEIKTASGQYLMPDDPVFEPIYKDIAAHNKTLITHSAAVDVAWEAQDENSPSAKYFVEKPQWDMSRPGSPEKKVILDARDHLLAMNPGLRVVGAHFGSMTEHLDDLGTRLDRYPNFVVDTAARVQQLVVQPRDRVLAFILKYQDRILYGTDLRFEAGTGQTTSKWESEYALDWRYFATDDTFQYHGHTVEGLNLPRPVLQKLYHDNAVRWIPGIDANLP
jgi:predicted TIM-barrel fold metal-dependent hydrolase